MAQANLGAMYADGRRGVIVGAWFRKAAIHLFKLTADQGPADAQAALKEVLHQQQKKKEEEQRKAAEEERLRHHREQDEKRKEAAADRERRRRQEEKERQRRGGCSGMSTAQAFETLGLKVGAGEQDIRAAYARLIKLVHPDVGGTHCFAKQLNEARDVLLRK